MKIAKKITAWLGLILTAVLFASCQRTVDPELTVLPENKYDKTLVVATDDDYWPYVYYDGNGQLKGHDIELITVVANKLEYNLEIRPMTWEESLDAVRSGEANAVLTCEYLGKDVVDGIVTTAPVKSDDFVIFAKTKFSSVDELYGKRIGVMKNGNVLHAVTDNGLTDDCVLYDSNRAAFDALAAGECDCVAVRYIIGLGILNEMGSSAKGIDGYVSLAGSRSCIGVGETETALAAEISAAINALRADGTLTELNEKWVHVHYPEHTFQGFLKKYRAGIAVTASLVLFVIAVIFVAQRQTYKSAIRLERKHSLALEQAKAEAEAGSRAKTAFLFNMSHDIRTPMNAIIGFNNMAASHIDDKETVRDCLEKAEHSSKQLLTLINDVLDMARIDSGNVTCNYAPVDLVSFATELTDTVRASAQKSLSIFANVENVRARYVMADVLHTERILTNILGNSVKYTPDGGKITFTLRESEENGRFDFIIEDNGIGMSEEFLSHIYEEFSREKTSTVSGTQGTGLGMAITKKLVDLLGGTIEIESKLGEGTKTTVCLPMAQADERDVKKTDEEELPDGTDEILKGRRVLLVEDNELNREIAVDILTEEGMDVDTAEDGDVAVEKVKTGGPGRYDLILMDIQMPRMNGYEATRAIRTLSDLRLAAIPIIAMTANAFEEDKQNAFASGMNDHVAKPIDVSKLKASIAKCVKWVPKEN